ncbi:MAG: sigma-70 family RNA polymerase sigma factor [Gemmatimonadaceae bacterium]|nr:sigma-70 family RNA polymerase sigma factor [Gemmatimonadaceae bacterium]
MPEPTDAFELWVAQTTTQYLRVRDASLVELQQQVLARKEAALHRLYQLYASDLEAKVRRLGPEATARAAEVVNDVFLRLPETLVRYEEDGRFPAWLFTQAMNRWRTIRRSIRRDRLQGDGELPPIIAPPSSVGVRIDRERLRAEAEARLSDTEREAWLLSLEGYSRQEIGDALGITANAAGVRLDRAKKRLRDLMHEYLR